MVAIKFARVTHETFHIVAEISAVSSAGKFFWGDSKLFPICPKRKWQDRFKKIGYKLNVV